MLRRTVNPCSPRCSAPPPPDRRAHPRPQVRPRRPRGRSRRLRGLLRRSCPRLPGRHRRRHVARCCRLRRHRGGRGAGRSVRPPAPATPATAAVRTRHHSGAPRRPCPQTVLTSPSGVHRLSQWSTRSSRPAFSPRHRPNRPPPARPPAPRARRHPELREDVVEVRAHRAVRQVELLADLAVGQPRRRQPGDLELLGGESLGRGDRPGGAGLAGRPQLLAGALAPRDGAQRITCLAGRPQRHP